MCKCENNIKMDLKGTQGEGVDWIDLTQDKDKWRVNCEHDDEFAISGNCEEFFE